TSTEARNKFEHNKSKSESSYFNIYLPLAGIIAFYFVLLFVLYAR
ncbi:DotU family type IV/VI secretion system protein, partial [Escherichia coli]|nr:DotU family type IV/VI secretion system protein [Escherichia coli]